MRNLQKQEAGGNDGLEMNACFAEAIGNKNGAWIRELVRVPDQKVMHSCSYRPCSVWRTG